MCVCIIGIRPSFGEKTLQLSTSLKEIVHLQHENLTEIAVNLVKIPSDRGARGENRTLQIRRLKALPIPWPKIFDFYQGIQSWRRNAELAKECERNAVLGLV